MVDATISRVRTRDLARPGRYRPGDGDLVASTIWHPCAGRGMMKGMRARAAVLVALGLVLVWSHGAAGRDAQVPPALVFARGGDLYRMTIDGSETVRLTATRAVEADPAVSPDGLRIGFVRGKDELWTSDLQGASRSRLVAARPRTVRYASTGSPTWSADGRWIYFDRASQTPNEICGSIFRVGSAGGAPRRVTPGLIRGSLDSDPAVSPDGRRIALVTGDCQPGCCPGIAVVDTAGRPTPDLRRLGPTRGVQLAPSWAPDGNRLAFVVYDVDGSGRSAVHIVTRNGSGLRRITQWTFETGAPAWSPDGRQIAFHKEGGLFLVDADGASLQRVPGTRARDTSPAWLPRR
jgi:TolB protein